MTMFKVPESVDDLDIAIIGMACRFPGAASLDQYWRNLADGVESITFLTAEQLKDAGVDPKRIDDPAFVKASSTLEGVDRFDAGFFGYSPREARQMDPQSRQFLECAWEAFESSGYNPRSLSATVGVFAAQSLSTYLLGAAHHTFESREFSLSAGNLPAVLGNGGDFLPTRVSYKLHLNGPSVNVQTACSSSLVAVHLARQAIIGGECDMALAGAVSIYLPQQTGYMFSDGMILSPDGHCRPFDKNARGTVFGRGVGVVILKPLAKAIADGDCVRAVIKGSAVNNDGWNRAGYTAPGIDGQARVVGEALGNAGVDADSIGYVEAHGTGTAQGDPIEVAALTQAFRNGSTRKQYCALGSVKSNIGHLDVAAGMAGLIKTVLTLEHRQIPPTLHYSQPNPQIDFGNSPFFVNTALRSWDGGNGPRRAGVSSFGMGGTNAHVVLEEAPVPEKPAADVDRPVHILPLSARTPARLRDVAERYLQHLASTADVSIADVCYTAAAGREHFDARLALEVRSAADAREKLASVLADSTPRRESPQEGAPKIVFLFTGQGSQHAGMAHALYRSEPVFRQRLDDIDAKLRPQIGGSILSVIFGGADAEEKINQTAYTQPALFAVEYALAELVRSWGIEPAAVLGHSIGEYVAACVAGVFSLDDALKLVAARGRLMQALPAEGAMAAVMADEARVAAAIAPFGSALAIAAANGPENTVVSGKEAALESVMGQLEASGVRSQRLRVSHAFHSSLLDGMLEPFERIARTVKYSAPRIPIASNVTGDLAPAGLMDDASYWVRHARETVRFADGIRSLAASGCRIFLEVGPEPILCAMGQKCAADESLTWLPSLRRNQDDWTSLASSLRKLYEAGVSIDWREFDRSYPRRRVQLPTYPFERERHWIEAPAAQPRRNESVGPVLHPLLGHAIRSAAATAIFECELQAGQLAILDDHRVGGVAILPATGFVEIMLAAGARVFEGRSTAVEDLAILEPLTLEASGIRTMQVVVNAKEDGRAECKVCSLMDDGSAAWRVHATATISRDEASAPALDLQGIRDRCLTEVTGVEHYERLKRLGNDFGPELRTVQRLWVGRDESLVEIRQSDDERTRQDFLLHPAMLDGCIQTLIDITAARADDEGYLPIGVDRVRRFSSGGPELVGILRLRAGEPSGSRLLIADLDLVDPQGSRVASAEGLRFARVARESVRRAVHQRNLDSVYQIEWQTLETPSIPARPAGETGSWLILADRAGTGRDLAARLEATGHQVVLVDDAGAADLSSLPPSTVRIVHLQSLDSTSSSDGKNLETLDAEIERSCGSALAVVSQLLSSGRSGELWFVTRGAHSVTGSDLDPSFEQSALWGFVNSLRREQPDLRCRLLDLDRSSKDAAATIWREVCLAADEEHVAERGGRRLAMRLVRAAKSADARASGAHDVRSVRLEIGETGLLDSLEVRDVPRQAPGPNEIEVSVQATGLNFRDVLNALGLYGSERVPFGAECAGVVSALGSGVSEFAVGDQVFGMAPASFGSFAVGDARHFVRRPAALSPAEAASIPLVFLTADYALNVLGHLKAGDRVLIHAGAGGVGLAAIQLAKLAGAEIFATAGSDEKRAFLRALGVHHVMNSRTLDFEREVLSATGGRGVDLVLNSLTGEFIRASFACLATGGRFLEIGKNGIWSNEDAAQHRPDAAYFVIFLGAVEPDTVRTRFMRLMPQFQQGALRPLPLTPFPLSQAADAFRLMAQARHIGKLVILNDRVDSPRSETRIRADATYLITGGLGALGLVTARWLAARGARSVALMGRRAPGEAAVQAIRDLEAQDVTVRVIHGDVASNADVDRTVQIIDAEMLPLRGIVHAAGVLDDGVVERQTWQRLSNVLAAKAGGAWNLHRLTLDRPIDFFVSFSSIASVVGSAGQTSYAAANAFLDGFAQYRRARGLPAVSVNWGPWAEGGMAASLDARDRERIARIGLGAIREEHGAELLDLAINHPSAQMMAAIVDWPAFLAQADLGATRCYDMLRHGSTRSRSANAASQTSAGDLAREVEAAPAKRRRAVVFDRVRAEALKVLGVSPSIGIAADRPLNELGLDSLMAIELRNTLGRAIGRTLPPTLLFKSPSLAALTETLLLELGGSNQQPPAPEPRPESDDRIWPAAGVDELTDEEVSAGLAEELAALSETTWGNRQN